MKKSLYLSILFVAAAFGRAQAQAPGFYDPAYVQDIYINFAFNDWDYKLDSIFAVNEENRLIAYNVIINGQILDSVGVRYKGNSSYDPSFNKNPFSLDLEYVINGQDYQGYSTIKLSNGFKDPSFVREVQGYEIARQYMPAPEANYARVYVNGQYRGIYSNVQSINKDFRDQYFYSSSNPFFKCDPIMGQPPIPGCNPGGAALEYLGPDTTCYLSKYEIESDTGWNELIRLTRTLNTQAGAIESALDVDRALWMVVYDNLLVNLDSYLGSGHNYYIYEDDNGRFNTILWDLNEVYGEFANGGQGQLSLLQRQQLSPTHNFNLQSRPILYRLMTNPRWRKSYMAHFRTMLEENFTNGSYLTRAQALQNLIDADVLADNVKFYTYNDFHNNLNVDAAQVPGIGSFMQARMNYLSTNNDLAPAPPVIQVPVATPGNPLVGTDVTITTVVTNTTSVKFRSRANREAVFGDLQMYDDGQHGDGAANDNTWGITVTMPMTGQLQYYIYAENANAARFSPERAEFVYYTLIGTFNNLASSAVVVNEFMASNTFTIADNAGEYDDWIELKNLSGAFVNLAGTYLSDDAANPTKFAMPDTLFPPGGYLMIWADEDGVQGPTHANFKLSGNGERIYLFNNDGSVVDSVIFSLQAADVSMGRCPDGIGNFVSMQNTTPGAVNNCPVDANEVAALPFRFSVNPNPVTNGTALLELGSGETLTGTLQLFDNLGRLISQQTLVAPEGLTQVPVSLHGLAQGLYQFVFTSPNHFATARIVIN